ncbi:hypothetical protein G6F50_018736 [Rhizopus delemar]|uniref:Uncharacterized protein n=1 Tax=Rhizopus delemar TaxID=936053 RepID=A0A9P6XL69_9FUNG|nr:hypothetical protein G6F24_014128 [Rhizopus arrhizus]KAG1521134.1 hypothetical protein G6F50_018736 [Rhizopus delemar]
MIESGNSIAAINQNGVASLESRALLDCSPRAGVELGSTLQRAIRRRRLRPGPSQRHRPAPAPPAPAGSAAAG